MRRSRTRRSSASTGCSCGWHARPGGGSACLSSSSREAAFVRHSPASGDRLHAFDKRCAQP
eukprot:scaffold44635_cov66-Phaeocystis_antarctica.AAC.3